VYLWSKVSVELCCRCVFIFSASGLLIVFPEGDTLSARAYITFHTYSLDYIEYQSA
jgi:hypothetical protein